jgi:uncharacterized protein YbjT (DUF2867 family)
MAIKVIVTGSTGMVGEGVLHECLLHPDVSEVLVVNRRPCNVIHPKLKEILHSNFFDLSALETQLAGYDACYFCLGVTSIGKNEEEYTKYTYTLTMHFAQALVKYNSGMVLCYVSGAGTDSTEKGRSMWARVKGKTENDLMKLHFKKVYAFRPGIMKATKGAKNTLKAYKYFAWMYPFLRFLFPKYVCTLKEVGLAMINAALKGYPKNIIEVPDIVALAHM